MTSETNSNNDLNEVIIKQSVERTFSQISKFDSVKNGKVIKIEISQDGKSVITLKKEKDSYTRYNSKIYVGYHRIETKTDRNSQTNASDNLSKFDNDVAHDDLGFFETNTNLNWSVAVIDTSEDICWIAFSFYDFSNLENKSDSVLGNYLLNHRYHSFSEKSVFFLVYQHLRKSVQPIHVAGTGNGIIKFLNDKELIILRRNNFRIIRYNSKFHLITGSTGIYNFFWSIKAFWDVTNTGNIMRKKRIDTDYAYPLPMNKFAKNSKYTKDIVEHKLTNSVKGNYLYSISRHRKIELWKIERYNLSTGQLDKLFNINQILAKVQKKEYIQNDDKNKEILPVFAVSIDKEQQYLAASLGFNSFTIYFMLNSIELVTCELPDDNAKIKFMAFIASNTKLLIVFEKPSIEDQSLQGQDIEKGILIWNMPGTLKVEENWETAELRRIANHHHLELTDIEEPENVSIKSYHMYKLEYKGEYKDEYKVKDLKFLVREDGIFYTNYKKDGLIQLFYQNPDRDENLDGNQQKDEQNRVYANNYNKGWKLEDCIEKEIIIDGKEIIIGDNEKEIIICGKEKEFTIGGNKIIDSNDGKKKITINGKEKKIIIDKIRIKIIVGNKIVRILKRHEEEYFLINIWSIPTDFSKYLTDPIISKIEFVEKNQSVKVTLKSCDEKNNLKFSHNLAIQPQATSIVGICSILSLMMNQKEEYKKTRESQKVRGNFIQKFFGAETNQREEYEWEECEKLIRSIGKIAPNIIKEAIRDPDNFRILDARFRIVATMIKANFQNLVIDYILNEPEDRLHIPQQTVQDKPKEPSFNTIFTLPKSPVDHEHFTALSIAINQNQYETIEKLLDYYSTLARDNSSWMATVTQVLPELMTKFPKNFMQLMDKEVFYSKEIPLDKSWEFYRPNNDLDEIRSFYVEFNLFDTYRQQEYENKKNNMSRYRKTNMKYFQVPLPGFISCSASTEKMTNAATICDFFLAFFLLERNHDESPFIRLIGHDKTGEIYDNPSIEAVVDFQCRDTVVYCWFRAELILYCWYAIGFIWISYAYLNRIVYNDNQPYIYTLIGLFIGAYTLLITTLKRGRYLANKQLFVKIFYAFELASLALQLIGYGMIVYNDLRLESDTPYCQKHGSQCKMQIIFYSLASLIVWIGLVFLLVGFAISMLLLLRFAPGIGILPIVSTFNGSFIAENSDNETAQILENNVTYPNFTIKQNLNWADRSDNYYYFWDKSVEAVYFWISGRWDQITNWNFWPVDVVTVLASIFLVTLMQNLLIGLMGGVLGKSTLDHRAIIQMRAFLLIDYRYVWQRKS
ncbi:825_t:CDS:2, partial [Ambispora gerdemannii]